MKFILFLLSLVLGPREHSTDDGRANEHARKSSGLISYGDPPAPISNGPRKAGLIIYGDPPAPAVGIRKH